MDDERFVIIEATIPGAEPRFQAWDKKLGGYLPGYWGSEVDAREGAKMTARG